MFDIRQSFSMVSFCSVEVEYPDFKAVERIRYNINSDMGTSAVFRVIERCSFNSVPDPFNGQIVNSILKPPKVIESRIYV